MFGTIYIKTQEFYSNCQVRWRDGLNVLLIFYTKFITYSNNQSSRISQMEMCTSFCLGPIKMRYFGADILNPISQADKFIFHGNKTLEVDGLHSKILWPKQLNTKMSSGASLWWMTTPVNSWKTNPNKRSSTRTVHLKFLSRFERFLWWGPIQKAGTTSQFQVLNS